MSQTFNFLNSPLNIFKHQTAELIHGLRYPSRLSTQIRDYAIDRICDSDEHFYVRMQSCVLAGRFRLFAAEIQRIRQAFSVEDNELVLSALLMPLAQSVGEPCLRHVGELMHHPNERIRILGGYVFRIQTHIPSANRFLGFVFDAKNQMRLCDYLGYVWYVVSSPRREILQRFLDASATSAKNHKVMDVRDRLDELRDIASARIALMEAPLIT